MRRIKVSVIIPAYNEAERLEGCVAEVDKTLRSFTESYEIIIAQDGSTDGTDMLAGRLAAQNPHVRHLGFKTKLGRGRALKNAFVLAKGEVVAYIDADLATSLNFLEPLVKEARKSGIAIGSRLVDGAEVSRPFTREVLSRAYNLLIRMLFRDGIYDHQCGFKAFNRNSLWVLDLVETNGWFWDTEVVVRAKRMGQRVAEMPVVWREKRLGGRDKSKVKIIRNATGMGWQALKLWWRLRYS